MIARRILAAALAPAALLLGGLATAQGPLARLLPADTIIYVSMPDLDTSIQEFHNTPLAKIWREPQIQDFFAGVLKLAEEKWNEGMEQARGAHEQGMLPFDPDELVKMRIHGLSFAVTEMSVAMPDGASEPMPRFGLVVHADFGDSAPIWQNVIRTMIGMAQAEVGADLAVVEKDIAGSKVTVMGPADMPDFPMGLHLSFVGNGMLISTLESDQSAVLTAMKAGDTSSRTSLVDSANFRRMSSKLEYAGAEMEFYMRPGAMFDFVGTTLRMARDHAPNFPPMLDVDGLDRAFTALGLRSFDAVGSTWHYKGNGSVSDSFVSMPLDGRQGLTSGMSAPLDMHFLKWVPKDAVAFSASRLGLSNVYSSLVGALRAYNEDMAEMMLSHLSQMEEQLGLSLEKDVFGALGDEFISWSMPMAGMTGLPEMAYIMKVNNEDGLVKSLQKIASMSRDIFSIEKVERRGTTYWQVQIRFDDLDQFGGMNPLAAFTPTFAFKNGYLVGGLSTQDVRRASQRMDREDDPAGDIRGNPEFKPYAEQIPSGINSISFTDWKTQFDGYYQILSAAFAFIPFNEDVPIDPALLPDSSTITKHLFGSFGWSRDSKEGVYTHGVGPFGPELVVVLTGGIAAGTGAYLAARNEFR